jgi:hypothetical protein
MYLRGTQSNPMLVFESRWLVVSVEFSFIRTANADNVNGIRLDVRLQNWHDAPVNAGVRMLLDTYLGEKAAPHFRTNLRMVDSEKKLSRADVDHYWSSSRPGLSLMGSIFVEGTYPPDVVHFANWKRLSDARWQLNYVEHRRFNALPFSINDSGVCYYLEARPMERWEQRIMTIMLAVEDPAGFLQPVAPVVMVEELPQPVMVAPQPAPVIVQPVEQPPQIIIPAQREAPRYILPPGPIRLDISTLRELVRRIDEYIYYGTDVSEEELRGMEDVMKRLHLRYGGAPGVLP